MSHGPIDATPYSTIIWTPPETGAFDGFMIRFPQGIPGAPNSGCTSIKTQTLTL